MALSTYDLLVAYLPQLARQKRPRPDGGQYHITYWEPRQRSRAGRGVTRWIDLDVQETWGRSITWKRPRSYRVWADRGGAVPEYLLAIIYRLLARDTVGRLPLLPPDVRRYVLAAY